MSEAAVVIAGAGPVGLTMALELARHGVGCRLIDRSPEPSRHSKALVLWPRTLELLDLGPGAAPFVEAGMPIQRARLFGDGEALAAIELCGLASPYPFALMIPQHETERVLAECAAARNVAVERGVEIRDLSADADGVTVQLQHAGAGAEELRCQWLIGCDGAHSTVRRRLGIDFAGTPEANDWMLADVHVSGAMPTDELRIYWHAEGLLAVFPIIPGRCRIVADVGPAATAEKAPDPSLADVQRVVDTRGPAGLTLYDPLWLASFRINERKVADYRRGRVFLAGDAAHIHSPAGGQGMNTGMQDAINLAWKLGLVARGRAGEALLDSYSRERSAVGDMVLRNAGALTRMATLRHRRAQRLRNALLPLAASTAAVTRRIRDTLGELSIAYRRSPIVRDERGIARWLRPLRAGDRAPDIGLTDPRTGARVDSVAALRRSRHLLLLWVDARSAEVAHVTTAVQRAFPDLVDTLLIARGAAMGPGDGPVLLDPAGSAQRAYGVRGRAGVLIRPDAYVGWIADPIEPVALLRHLQRYLL